jgi:hypothetical protein
VGEDTEATASPEEAEATGNKGKLSEHSHQWQVYQEDIHQQHQEDIHQGLQIQNMGSNVLTIGTCVSVVGSTYPSGIPVQHAPHLAGSMGIKTNAPEQTGKGMKRRATWYPS